MPEYRIQLYLAEQLSHDKIFYAFDLHRHLHIAVCSNTRLFQVLRHWYIQQSTQGGLYYRSMACLLFHSTCPKHQVTVNVLSFPLLWLTMPTQTSRGQYKKG